MQTGTVGTPRPFEYGRSDVADPSFDIVSKVDRQELDNAVNQAAKELSTRFDFRGTGAQITHGSENGGVNGSVRRKGSSGWTMDCALLRKEW